MAEPLEKQVDHRPWPLPNGPWILSQSLSDRLFMHWPVAARDLIGLVPDGLEIDEHDGAAWVSLTPSCMDQVRPRLVPPVPLLRGFPEMCLRTYVRAGDRPGIYFFSIDVSSRLAVVAARHTLYRLPFFHSEMEAAHRDGWLHYESRRTDGQAVLRGRYRPAGAVWTPEPGSLEYFLIERYAIYSVLAGGKVMRAELHHLPWRVQPAEASIEINTVPEAHGIPVDGRALLLHYAAGQSNLVWGPQVVG
jgi:uncharacterized protein